jgi:lipopolysaccharide biosynthesis regulator YciM
MSSTTFAQWLKSNWYLPLLLAGVVVALIIGKSATVQPDGPPPAAGGDQNALKAEFERAKAQSATRETAAEAEKSTDTIIAEHTAKLDLKPEPDDAAALLSALGNLHKQKKQDYAAAARYYEQIIQDYPEWPGIKGVYHQLMACYSQLDDQANLRLLYRKMVEVFPPESNEYQFAKDALGE